MGNYAPSTRARIADLITGMHVRSAHGVLTYLNFVDTTQTELFTVIGRIAVKQLFIELTSAADTGATQISFNCTFTTPAIIANIMGAKCASIASAPAGTAITYVAGAVASTTSITDGAYLTDVETAGRVGIVGGQSAAGVNTIGSIGMLGDDANQAGTITATAHLYYYPMSKGAYAESLL